MSRRKMKPEMTVTELARAGGKARKEALSPSRRSRIAEQAAEARWYRSCDDCHGTGRVAAIGTGKKVCLANCYTCQGTGLVRR